MKSLVLSLAFIMKFTAIRKWPIAYLFNKKSRSLRCSWFASVSFPPNRLFWREYKTQKLENLWVTPREFETALLTVLPSAKTRTMPANIDYQLSCN